MVAGLPLVGSLVPFLTDAVGLLKRSYAKVRLGSARAIGSSLTPTKRFVFFLFSQRTQCNAQHALARTAQKKKQYGDCFTVYIAGFKVREAVLSFACACVVFLKLFSSGCR